MNWYNRHNQNIILLSRKIQHSSLLFIDKSGDGSLLISISSNHHITNRTFMFYKNITAPRSVVKKTPCFLTFGHDMRMTIWTNYKIEGKQVEQVIQYLIEKYNYKSISRVFWMFSIFLMKVLANFSMEDSQRFFCEFNFNSYLLVLVPLLIEYNLQKNQLDLPAIEISILESKFLILMENIPKKNNNKNKIR